jgi:ATP-GRASP peptide maturase of grasp-with-spasm system
VQLTQTRGRFLIEAYLIIVLKLNLNGGNNQFYKNMIVILSQLFYETSTNDVIDWLDMYGIEYKRINGIELIFHPKDNSKLSGISRNKISKILLESRAVWFRRWMSSSCFQQIYQVEQCKLSKQLNSYNYQDFQSLTELFFSFVRSTSKFNELPLREINKLIVLDAARKLNLSTPKSFIVSNMKNLLKINSRRTLISKSISGQDQIQFENDTYKGYTTNLEFEDKDKLNFFPSFVQEKIHKKFEIRSVCIDKKIFSMAIFSQDNPRTETDFRHYDIKNPNRTVPFKLPKVIEKKLLLLAKHFHLNVCSFDLIKDLNNKFIFLEVNPGGQFGMTSRPCNYPIEKEIALSLVNKNEINNDCKTFK